MIDTTLWEQSALDYDKKNILENLRNQNSAVVDSAFNDLITFALDSGLTGAQARGAVEGLFRTYLQSWVLYLFVGADDIITDIQNDATLGWLDTDVAGTSIRQRLINRLS